MAKSILDNFLKNIYKSKTLAFNLVNKSGLQKLIKDNTTTLNVDFGMYDNNSNFFSYFTITYTKATDGSILEKISSVNLQKEKDKDPDFIVTENKYQLNSTSFYEKVEDIHKYKWERMKDVIIANGLYDSFTKYLDKKPNLYARFVYHLVNVTEKLGNSPELDANGGADIPETGLAKPTLRDIFNYYLIKFI